MRSSLIKSILVPMAALGLAAFFVQACGSGENNNSGSGNPGSCTPNSTQQCFCDTGETKVQTCTADGTWTQCPCGSTGSAGGGGNGGGGGGGAESCVPGGSMTVLCGNGTIDPGEECDDGNCVANDACSDKCKNPFCGDKIVQEGEDCDDGQNEVGDMCPDDCQIPNDGGMDADPCQGQLIFTDFTAPSISQWSYQGSLGYDAGTKMCQALGAAGVCDYEQLAEVLNNQAAHPVDVQKMLMDVPAGSTVTVWVNRTTPVVVNGQTYMPGPGGTCNNWTYNTDHAADGEYLTLTNTGGVLSGTFTFDNDTVFTGNGADGHAGPGLGCGSGGQRLIACCFPICQSP